MACATPHGDPLPPVVGLAREISGSNENYMSGTSKIGAPLSDIHF
jgi:hypothetical protein